MIATSPCDREEGCGHTPGGRLGAVTALRVAFILMILGAHVREYLNFDPYPLIGLSEETSGYLGRYGVVGFVFLSGFSLGLGYLGRPIKYRSFLLRRLSRLWPLYALVVALHLVPTMYISLANALAHLAMVNVFFPAFSRNPGSIWFVAMIVQLYVIAPPLLKQIAAGKALAVLAGATLVYLFSLWLHTVLGSYTLDSFANYLPDFVAGAVGASLFGRRRVTHRGFIGIGLAMAISGLVWLAADRSGLAFEVAWKLVCLGGAIGLLGVAIWTLKSAAPDWLEELGAATLGVFLFHRLVWRWMLLLVGPADPLARLGYLVVVGVPLIFLLGWLGVRGQDRLVSELLPSRWGGAGRA